MPRPPGCGSAPVAVEEHLEEVDAVVLVSFGGVISLGGGPARRTGLPGSRTCGGMVDYDASRLVVAAERLSRRRSMAQECGGVGMVPESRHPSVACRAGCTTGKNRHGDRARSPHVPGMVLVAGGRAFENQRKPR